ncbi:hypothetical protein BH23BAC3_BH23BAC3_15620 [soil metagenome]
MSIDYIAILDHDHLDNGLFLSSFAKAVAAHNHRGLILHSDSAYTDRIMQTGVMREDARLRAIKDLNHRLIALFADQGVSAIGLNGYQREMISVSEQKIEVDVKKIRKLPDQPVLLISSLIYSADTQKPVSGSLAHVARALKKSLNIEDLFLFTRNVDDEIIKKDLPVSISEADDAAEFIKTSIPVEFQDELIEGILTTASEFQKYPDIKNATKLYPVS